MTTIRRESPSDVAAIRNVHLACFRGDGEARLVDALREQGHLSISLVAVVAGAVVGHVAFSPVATVSGSEGAGLGPIAVLEQFRRQGIAAELVQTGLDAAREAGFGWCVVLGNPSYYRRFNFVPASTVGLVDEYGGGDAFQAIQLIAGQLPHNAGLVRYGPEFAELS